MKHRLRSRYGHAAHPRELAELKAILTEHGYDPKDAKRLNEEGMGPYELEHRIKSTRAGAMGSLEYSHGIHKRYGHSVARFGTRVHYRGAAGRIESYVPFDKYYVRLDRGGRVLARAAELGGLS